MSDSASDDDPSAQATGTSKTRSEREKERLKETSYMTLYKELLRKHRGLLQEERTSDFADETALVQEAIASQRQIWIAGIGIGLMAFAALRYGPNLFIRRFLGEAKVKAIDEADQQARERGTLWLRRGTALCMEGAVAFWAGHRAYHLAAEQSDDTYELIAKVPLCAGRSVLAEQLCGEWIDISQNQVSPLFWQNLTEGTLRDERAWKAIRGFSENCIRRQRYEAQMRRKTGITDPNEPIVLPNKVPEFDVQSLSTMSRNEAQELVNDQR